MSVKISDILILVRKGKNKTLYEQDQIEQANRDLQTVDSIKIENSYIPLSIDQRNFANYILYDLIRKNAPRIDKILKVFDLNIDTILCYRGVNESEEEYM